MTQEERDYRVQDDRQLKQQRQQMLRQQHAQQATGGTAGQPLSRSGGGDGHRITANSIAGLTFAGGELPV